MSSSARASSQEKFVCALCLDVFSDPATIPCGHSFCLPCIARYWELRSDTGKANCPQCLRTFTPIPRLQKNLTLCEILEDLQASAEISSGSHPAGPGDVTCDICTKTKVKGGKSCLDCLLTYCGPHLQPHHQEAALKDHVLVDPIKHLHTQRDCAAHGEPLDWFCRTEGESICRLCVAEQHIIHDVVTVPEEVAQQQELILRNSSTLKQQLQKTLAEISDLQVNVDSVKNSSQEVRSEIIQKFTVMVKLIEEAHKEAIAQINNDEQVTLGQAKSVRTQLQQRRTELTAGEDQLRKLLKINDNLIFLQESRCVQTGAQPLEIPQFKQQTDAQSTMACVKVSVNDLGTSIKQQVISFCKQIQDKQNIGRTCSRTKHIRPVKLKKTMIKNDLQCSAPSIVEAPQSGHRMELLSCPDLGVLVVMDLELRSPICGPDLSLLVVVGPDLGLLVVVVRSRIRLVVVGPNLGVLVLLKGGSLPRARAIGLPSEAAGLLTHQTLGEGRAKSREVLGRQIHKNIKEKLAPASATL
ncbi:E3 ubiquitin/ISG15 ligase TRIM25-like [Hemiscyllium ocellatum]|uniref:E3 ubiquitin/ISG15 ligase TRIM25-like n=1 Tax=Hemiscyllium ocellatum TaxID=170820 RepID=UPI0029662076|nr:E3 ubiquitin/ISG15 ligase TRIM25-like [Hemiscyllium ocellatum]